MHIVNPFRVTFSRGREKKSACFWLSPSSTILSPPTIRVSRASMIFSLGRISPFIQGRTSCIRRRFSSRRVVQERETGSRVWCGVDCRSHTGNFDNFVQYARRAACIAGGSRISRRDRICTGGQGGGRETGYADG